MPRKDSLDLGTFDRAKVVMPNKRNKSILPFQARGFDFEPFAMELRPDGKIIFILKDEPDVHYTLSPGNKSGIVEWHRTTRSPNGQVTHEPLGGIRREDIASMSSEGGMKMFSALKGLYIRIRPGWMYHRKIKVIYSGNNQKEIIYELLKPTKKRRVTIDQEKLIAINQKIQDYDDLLDFPDGSMFQMYKHKRKGRKEYGMLIKVSHPDGYPHLHMVTHKKFKKFIRDYESIFHAVYKKYGLSPEKIGKELSGII